MRAFYICLFAVISLGLVIWNQVLKYDIKSNPTLSYTAHLVSCYETTIGKKSHRRIANACLFKMGEDYQELHYSDKVLWERRKLEVGDNVEVLIWDHRPRNIEVTKILGLISTGITTILFFFPRRKEEESYLPE